MSLWSTQPDAAAGEDSMMVYSLPTLNFGTLTIMSAGTTVGPPTDFSRSLIRFDLSALPSNQVIGWAKLILYVNAQAGSGSLYVARCTKAWVEAEVSWNNYKTGSAWDTPGGDWDGSDVVTSAFVGAGSDHTIDITSLAVDAMRNRSGVLNLLLKKQFEISGDNYIQYRTSDHATPADRPELQMELIEPAPRVVKSQSWRARELVGG